MHASIHDSQQSVKRAPGRPRCGAAAKGVAEKILNATESLLKQYSHHELTERKIAIEANVDQKMISYYFGDKNGLLFDIIARCTDDVYEKLNELLTIPPSDNAVTEKLFRILIDAYFTKPWVHRIMASELSSEQSTIKRFFVKKYGPLGRGSIFLQKALDRLIELGVYSRRVDTHLAALTVFSIISAPYMKSSILYQTGDHVDTNQYRKEEWIRYLTDLFDHQLKSD